MSKELPSALSAQEKLSRCFDDKAHALNVVDYSHHEVHEGDAFQLEITDSCGSSEYVEILLTPPALPGKEFHFVWEMTSTAAGHIQIIEGVDTISGGAAGTPRNQNRNSTTTTSSTQTLVGTVAAAISHANGTTIYGPRYFGAGQTNGAEATRAGEMILKAGSATVIRATSTAASNRIWLEASWYEHTDSGLQDV